MLSFLSVERAGLIRNSVSRWLDRLAEVSRRSEPQLVCNLCWRVFGFTQIATPKSKITQAMVSFSQRIVLAPSDLLSQKAAVVECICADGRDIIRSTRKQLTCRVSKVSYQVYWWTALKKKRTPPLGSCVLEGALLLSLSKMILRDLICAHLLPSICRSRSTRSGRKTSSKPQSGPHCVIYHIMLCTLHVEHVTNSNIAPCVLIIFTCEQV